MLENRQQRTVILERRKTDKASVRSPWLSALRHFLGCSHREGSTRQGSVPSLVEETGTGVWESRGAGS